MGVATIAAGVQRAGGSLQHPSAALDDALEQKAAYIEGGATPETSSLGLSGLWQLCGVLLLQNRQCSVYMRAAGMLLWGLSLSLQRLHNRDWWDNAGHIVG